MPQPLSDSLPLHAVDLIHELDQRYPLFNPDPADSLAILQRRAGRRDVVEFLLYRLRELESNPLEQ